MFVSFFLVVLLGCGPFMEAVENWLEFEKSSVDKIALESFSKAPLILMNLQSSLKLLKTAGKPPKKFKFPASSKKFKLER